MLSRASEYVNPYAEFIRGYDDGLHSPDYFEVLAADTVTLDGLRSKPPYDIGYDVGTGIKLMRKHANDLDTNNFKAGLDILAAAYETPWLPNAAVFTDYRGMIKEIREKRLIEKLLRFDAVHEKGLEELRSLHGQINDGFLAGLEHPYFPVDDTRISKDFDYARSLAPERKGEIFGSVNTMLGRMEDAAGRGTYEPGTLFRAARLVFNPALYEERIPIFREHIGGFDAKVGAITRLIENAHPDELESVVDARKFLDTARQNTRGYPIL